MGRYRQSQASVMEAELQEIMSRVEPLQADAPRQEVSSLSNAESEEADEIQMIAFLTDVLVTMLPYRLKPYTRPRHLRTLIETGYKPLPVTRPGDVLPIDDWDGWCKARKEYKKRKALAQCA